MIPFSGLINLLNSITELREILDLHLLTYCVRKGFHQRGDKQPDEAIHKVRLRMIPNTDAFVPMDTAPPCHYVCVYQLERSSLQHVVQQLS